MLPLLLSGNSGVNMMHGMAVIIVGGLVAYTILAMFLMPPFYLLFSGKDMNGMTRKERKAARAAQKEEGKNEQNNKFNFFKKKEKVEKTEEAIDKPEERKDKE